jgi:hypothetical protein
MNPVANKSGVCQPPPSLIVILHQGYRLPSTRRCLYPSGLPRPSALYSLSRPQYTSSHRTICPHVKTSFQQNRSRDQVGFRRRKPGRSSRLQQMQRNLRLANLRLASLRPRSFRFSLLRKLPRRHPPAILGVTSPKCLGRGCWKRIRLRPLLPALPVSGVPVPYSPSKQ